MTDVENPEWRYTRGGFLELFTLEIPRFVSHRRNRCLKNRLYREYETAYSRKKPRPFHQARHGEQRMAHKTYSQLADEYGCPFYIYEEAAIAERLALLRDTFPDFGVLYSVKTNPHGPVCRFMAGQGIGADAASSYEVERALEAGFPMDAIYYSAPGKTVRQLADSLGKCVITADSLHELERLERLAGERVAAGRKLCVGLRINPDLAYGPGEFPEIVPGVSSKFGVDVETLTSRREFFNSLRNIRLTGLHVFIRSQVLSHAAITAAIRATFETALMCRREFGWEMEFINFGGGMGTAAAPHAAALDTAALRVAVTSLVREYRNRLPDCTLLLESGRFLVGGAGAFVSRIEDVKTSRGTTYVIVPGGLNGFLRPSVMNLLHALPCEVSETSGGAFGPYEPLYTNARMHQVSLPEKTDGATVRATVCGNLCTALDVIARDAQLPDPQIGDIVAVSNAGAYAASLSPFAFASFPRPPELFRRRNGEISTS
jgi:diaminopimelate decarboxylase